MTRELVNRLVQLLQSPDKEMRELAVQIFKGRTKHYQSYWDIRSTFWGFIIFDPHLNTCFNSMFAHIDRRTIDNVLARERAKIDIQGKMGRHKEIIKNCKITTK